MSVLHLAHANASPITRLAPEEAGQAHRPALVASRQMNRAARIPTLDPPEGPLVETGTIPTGPAPGVDALPEGACAALAAQAPRFYARPGGRRQWAGPPDVLFPHPPAPPAGSAT